MKRDALRHGLVGALGERVGSGLENMRLGEHRNDATLRIRIIHPLVKDT